MIARAWDDVDAEHLAKVTALMGQLLTAQDPYEVGVEVWGCSGRAAGEVALNMQLIWGALTDWVQLKQEEGQQANTPAALS